MSVTSASWNSCGPERGLDDSNRVHAAAYSRSRWTRAAELTVAGGAANRTWRRYAEILRPAVRDGDRRFRLREPAAGRNEDGRLEFHHTAPVGKPPELPRPPLTTAAAVLPVHFSRVC